MKSGNAWERKYAEFESYDGMPEKGTRLYTWKQTQFSNGTGGRGGNDKITKIFLMPFWLFFTWDP
jgi:hypothetical protein